MRSGVLTSVHSFASDPTRGVFILVLLTLAIGGAFALYAARGVRLPVTPMFKPLSRETAMLLNNLLLGTACATVLTGTLYPMLLDALGGGIVSVGAPYFTTTVLPLFVPLAILTAAGPLLRWRQSDFATLLKPLGFALACSLLTALAVFYAEGMRSLLGLLGFALGVWVLVGTGFYGVRTKKLGPLVLAHGGLGLVILGMAGSAFSTSATLTLRPHDTAEFGGYKIVFESLDEAAGSNYAAERGIFRFYAGDEVVAKLKPERRFYPAQGMNLSRVAISTNVLRDIYVVMNAGDEEDPKSTQRTLRIQMNPLVPFLWIGGILMALGVLPAFLVRRKTNRNDDIWVDGFDDKTMLYDEPAEG